MMPLLVRTARFDAMRDAVVIDRRDAEVAVTRTALEAWRGKPVPAEIAVSYALSIEPVIRRAANAVQPDDGVVTITPRLMANVRETQDAD